LDSIPLKFEQKKNYINLVKYNVIHCTRNWQHKINIQQHIHKTTEHDTAKYIWSHDRNHLHDTVRSHYHTGYTDNQWCGKTTLHLSIYVMIWTISAAACNWNMPFTNKHKGVKQNKKFTIRTNNKVKSGHSVLQKWCF
jgi:hypothetical protein